jgi:predicted hydrocarbon binding protein
MTELNGSLERFARNPFREEHYFALNVKSGIIRSPTGTRMLGLPEELFVGLHAGLREETGEAAGVVLYTCGKWWGGRFWKRHSLELRTFYGCDMGDLPLHVQAHVMRRVFSLYGWGLVDTSFELSGRGFVEVTVEHAAYSHIVGNTGRCSDHLLAGVIATGLSELAGRELECAEIGCRSKGDATCSFIVGIKSRVAVAEAWVAQGKSRGDVVAAIAAGEVA